MTTANLSHPILNGFSPSDWQITWSAQNRSDSSGYPTGMQVLASPTGGSPGAASLGSIETGATTHIGAAAGRRVWFNLNQCYSNDMVIEFQSLLINTMNWAGE